MEEKTKLQKIKEQLEGKMACAIVAAIKEGTEYRVVTGDGIWIDGIYLAPKFNTEKFGFLLSINAPEIDKLLEPKREELKEHAEELRAELEEIEKQLNLNNYETDNNQRANH